MAGERATHPGKPGINWYDVLERAAWTAAQSFLGAISTVELARAVTSTDIQTLETLLLAGAGAAVAALASFLKTLAQERLNNLDTRA